MNIHLPKPSLSVCVATTALLALAGTTGCAGLGKRLERGGEAAGAPTAADVLRDLAANDSQLRNFRAAGAFTIQSPKLEAVERFPSGMVAFRKPADLRVEGRVRLNVVAFRLTCVGSEFLLEFPTKRDDERYYYRLNGETIENVPFSVSPSDVAREMFFPEEWGRLSPRDAQIRSYDPNSQQATLTIGPARRPRREITVQGPPWVIVSNTRLDEAGDALARTTLADYHRAGGVLFPARVEAYFPGQESRMTFEMRNIRVNTDLVDDSLFRITWRPGTHDQSDRTHPG